MRMEPMDNGCLKIWLNTGDMQTLDLRFEEMDARQPATRAAIAKLLQAARTETGFQAADGLLVEALPVDGGCLLLLTPGGALEGACPDRRRLRMVRAGGPLVYALDGVDQLFQLEHGWRRFRRPEGRSPGFREPATSLFRFGSQYRLVVYPSFIVPKGLRSLLSEFGTLVGEGDAAAAYTAEHGQALAIGDAIDQLAGLH